MLASLQRLLCLVLALQIAIPLPLLRADVRSAGATEVIRVDPRDQKQMIRLQMALSASRNFAAYQSQEGAEGSMHRFVTRGGRTTEIFVPSGNRLVFYPRENRFATEVPGTVSELSRADVPSLAKPLPPGVRAAVAAASAPLPAGISRACISGICADLSRVGPDPFASSYRPGSTPGFFGGSYMVSDNMFLNQALANDRFRPASPLNKAFLQALRRAVTDEAAAGPPGEKLRAQQAAMADLMRSLEEEEGQAYGGPQIAPFPSEALRETLEQDLNALEAAALEGSPVAIAGEVSQLLEKASLARARLGAAGAARAEFLEREALRMYLGADGLLRGLQFASKENIFLRTAPLSLEGRKIRAGLNQVLAVQEELGFLYRGVISDEFRTASVDAAYRNASARASALESSLELADTLYSSGFPELAGPIVAASQKDLGALKESLNFAKGFAQGFGKDLAINAASLAAFGLVAAFAPALATGATVALTGYAVYQAVSYLARHDLSRVFEEKLQAFRAASTEEKGRLAGIVTSQVVMALGARGGALSQAAPVMAGSARVLESTVLVRQAQVALANRVLTRAESELLTKVAEVAPSLAARLSAEGVDGAATKAFLRQVSVESIPGIQALERNGAGALAARMGAENPASLSELSATIARSSHDIAGHLGRIQHVKLKVGAERYTDDEIVEIARTYEAMASKMGEEAVSSYSGPVMRAVRKEVPIQVDGKEVVIRNTEAEVFSEHPGIFGQTNRADPPGRVTISTAVGPGAEEAILLEVEAQSTNELVYASQRVELARVLDFTRPDTAHHFGVDPVDLSRDFKKHRQAYMLTNIFTDLAYERGLDAVIFFSSKMAGVRNVYYFPRGAK